MAISLLKNFKIDLYSEKCTRSEDGFNALHIAARKGFTALGKMILPEFPQLLWVEDSSGHYPVEVAIMDYHYSTAVPMIRAMSDRQVSFIILFRSSYAKNTVAIDLCALLARASQRGLIFRGFCTS